MVLKFKNQKFHIACATTLFVSLYLNLNCILQFSLIYVIYLLYFSYFFMVPLYIQYNTRSMEQYYTTITRFHCNLLLLFIYILLCLHINLWMQSNMTKINTQPKQLLKKISKKKVSFLLVCFLSITDKNVV